MSEVYTVCSGYEQMLTLALERIAGGRKPRAAMAAHTNPLSLQALERAYKAGLVEPVIVGDQDLFERDIARYAPDLATVEVVDEEHPVDAVRIVADMVGSGEVDLVLHGGIMSASLLADLFGGESKMALPGKIISHVAVIKPSKYPKAIFVADGVVNGHPDLATKIGIIQNVIDLAHRVGVPKPRVGILAAVEVVYPQMPMTMEAAVLAKMGDRGQIKGAFIDGPLSFDTAVDSFAAQSKGIKRSEVAGEADVLIAPNAATAHGIYEAMQFFSDCQVGGIVVGTRVPFALSFPSDTVNTRYHSILLGVMGSAALATA
jgi:phosphotransacetylase